MGTVVLLRFPFTDLSGAKRRPAVVVGHAHGGDLVVACVSSKYETCGPYDVITKQEESSFAQTGLHATSVICVDKLATLQPTIATGKLGVVSSKHFIEIKKKLKMLFRL